MIDKPIKVNNKQEINNGNHATAAMLPYYPVGMANYWPIWADYEGKSWSIYMYQNIVETDGKLEWKKWGSQLES